MTLPTGKQTYFDGFSRRNRWTWVWSAAVALSANLLFFAGMPHLLQRNPVPPAFARPVDAVNILRMQRPDTPVRRKTVPPPEPEKVTKAPRPAVKAPITPQKRLVLPFEINPRLPAGPAGLQLPPMAVFRAEGIDAGAVFEAGQLDAPLAVVARIPPLYPLQAKRRGIEGWVKVRLLINENGGVETVDVMESHPPGIFDRSVQRSVSGWRFQAGTVEGIPVRTWAETTIRFQLN